jgi:hypothetical protein
VEPGYSATSLPVQGAPAIGRLEAEWVAYVERQDLAGLDRDRIRATGERLLVEAEGEAV